MGGARRHSRARLCGLRTSPISRFPTWAGIRSRSPAASAVRGDRQRVFGLFCPQLLRRAGATTRSSPRAASTEPFSPRRLPAKISSRRSSTRKRARPWDSNSSRTSRNSSPAAALMEIIPSHRPSRRQMRALAARRLQAGDDLQQGPGDRRTALGRRRGRAAAPGRSRRSAGRKTGESRSDSLASSRPRVFPARRAADFAMRTSIRLLLESVGVDRVIVGTQALKQPDWFRAMVTAIPEANRPGDRRTRLDGRHRGLA